MESVIRFRIGILLHFVYIREKKEEQAEPLPVVSGCQHEKGGASRQPEKGRGGAILGWLLAGPRTVGRRAELRPK